ncbi:SEC-C metal-binding domain-containing protein [Aeromonas sobria]|uniref:SEC-C metal-binding domain-containing protein n=1 Tax=Aeromonas sobria TaxID=646 RepID=UPI0011DF26ED|nr:SEC-C metal-binding domain-containing protein [Aeromonas sobria]
MTSIKTLMIEAIGELDQYSFDKLVECTLRASSIREDQECWCLSGKEYKACHKNRHLKKELNYYEIRDKISDVFDKKNIAAPNLTKTTVI